MAAGGAARRSPDLRVDPRGSDAGSREGEPVHMEVPRVQRTADDGDGVAYGGTPVRKSQIRKMQGKKKYL